jgi:hypothetical protein
VDDLPQHCEEMAESLGEESVPIQVGPWEGDPEIWQKLPGPLW